MSAERPLSVLLTADTVGGVWTYAVELARALAGHGVRVELAALGGPVSRAQRDQLAGIPRLGLHESSFKLEWMDEPWEDVARAGRWLLSLEQALQPDLLHLNQFAFGALPFEAPKLLVAHSCVLSWWRAVHGEAAPAPWDRYRTCVRQGLAGADAVAAPTQAMLDTLCENYDWGGCAWVLPNGRDARLFPPRRKQPFVLAAGRLWDEAKNLGALEAVAPRLDWPVRVAGSCAAPGGGERLPIGVQPLGLLSAELLAREMGRASIYALPAKYEPFGLSVLEAALAGCALVLGDIPSLRETWDGAALFVDPADAQALQQALQRLIGDAALRGRMAEAARRRGLLFQPRRMALACLAAYARLEPRFEACLLEEAACA